MKGYSGDWYLPNSNCKIPGKLYVNEEEKRIILQLFTSTFLNGEKIQSILNESKPNYHQIILGDTGSDYESRITLYSCVFTRLSSIGTTNFYDLRYRVNNVFTRIHVLSEEKLLFNRITIKIHNISTFYDG